MNLRIKYFKRKYKGKVYSYPCLGYSYRNKKGTPQFKIVQNLSKLPVETIEAIENTLKGNNENTPEMFTKSQVVYQGSNNIGATWAIIKIAEKLGIDKALKQIDNKYQKILLAMITDRVVNPKPYSKIELNKAYSNSALARIIGKNKASLHDWYVALEKLYEQQEEIENLLYENIETPSKIFLYDITSSYFEGINCPLSAWGYNRDGKKGKKQIVIGLLTSPDGRPLSIRVFKGNTSDQTTVIEEVRDVKNKFAIDEVIFIGDRGMLTSARRNDLKDEEFEMVKYISALSHNEIIDLIEDSSHPLQLELFEGRELAEIEANGVRYIICYNPEKRRRDRQDRNSLLNKTRDKLEKIRGNVLTGRYKKEKVIAKRVYRWLNKWKMGKFFHIFYTEGYFSYNIKYEKLRENENIDGYYLLVTTISQDNMNKEEIQKRYKSLSLVEQAFRNMKTSDLCLRPIRHWNPNRVKGHVFVCMLSYLIIWKARHLFSSFLERNEKNHYCEAGSLRRIWKELDGISIGKILVDDQVYEQISPLNRYQQQLLNAAEASIDLEAKRRLNLVG